MSNVNPMENAHWSFIAMEYYALILNRTYVINIKDDALCGVVCRGLTSIEGGGDTLTRSATGKLAVNGDINDPNSYVDITAINKPHRANFCIPLSDIRQVEYTPQKKWGMGYYPHDGRVFVVTPDSKREFIILGNQSGKEIATRLNAGVAVANKSFKPTPQSGA